MTTDLSWQFDLAWALGDLHLSALTEDDFLWEPAPLVWTVHPGEDGRWRPDWADAEPDPIPVPTIAWLTWHILWWWSTALDHLAGAPARDHTDVTWPGPDAVVTHLRAMAGDWRSMLACLDPAAPSEFPWGAGTDHTAAHTALWVNVELTKNISEIGQLRLLRAARR